MCRTRTCQQEGAGAGVTFERHPLRNPAVPRRVAPRRLRRPVQPRCGRRHHQRPGRPWATEGREQRRGRAQRVGAGVEDERVRPRRSREGQKREIYGAGPLRRNGPHGILGAAVGRPAQRPVGAGEQRAGAGAVTGGTGPVGAKAAIGALGVTGGSGVRPGGAQLAYAGTSSRSEGTSAAY